METFAKQRDAAAPDALIAAWDLAVAGWADPARHDEVLRLVTQHDAYAWAAARYRTRAAEGEPAADTAIADRQLARLRKAAEAQLFASATLRADKTPKPYRALTAVLVMLIMAAIAGLLYAIVVHDNLDNVKAKTTPDEPARPLQPIQRRPTN
jgi:hypothetical protein